jgi:predicted ferric reductase
LTAEAVCDVQRRARVPARPASLSDPPTRPGQPPSLEAGGIDGLESGVTLDVALLLFAGTAAGAIVAVVLLPGILPDLAGSMLGDQPKAYWYLSRSSGVVAYLMLWLSAVLGLSLTTRFARLWAGGPTVADLHQFASLLALALAVFHILILLGDAYASYRLAQLLVPFTASQHQPLWVGLGQVAFYLALPVTFSFYARRSLGTRAWRLIHYASFAAFGLTVTHGLGAGTDGRSPTMLTIYIMTSSSIVFLTTYRVLTTVRRRAATRTPLAR